MPKVLKRAKKRTTKMKKKVMKAKAKKKVSVAKKKVMIAKKTVKKVMAKKLPKKMPLLEANALGKVIHFYDKISVAIVELAAPMQLGDIVRIKHGMHEFVQPVTSMQIDHLAVSTAKKKDVIGIKVMEKVQEGSLVLPA